MAEQLNMYATTFRYPGDSPDPTKDEFDSAFHAAEKILDFVLRLLPPEVRPPAEKLPLRF